MNAGQAPDEAVARPDQAAPDDIPDAAVAVLANRAWEIDRTELLCRSEHRAWQVAVAGMALGLAGVAAVLVQGPLRRVVEIPIVVDKVTGETTIQQRLAEENVPRMDTMDKHNLATFVRARESYHWSFLQRDYDQVARMAVPAVFADHSRRFEGPDALQKKLAATEEWRIQVVSVRLAAHERAGNAGQATVTYDKLVRRPERNVPDAKSRHTASVAFEYQPRVLLKERDRLENPLGFVVTAYRSDPEINTAAQERRP